MNGKRGNLPQTTAAAASSELQSRHRHSHSSLPRPVTSHLVVNFFTERNGKIRCDTAQGFCSNVRMSIRPERDEEVEECHWDWIWVVLSLSNMDSGYIYEAHSFQSCVSCGSCTDNDLRLARR